jgi:hypothetical protein
MLCSQPGFSLKRFLAFTSALLDFFLAPPAASRGSQAQADYRLDGTETLMVCTVEGEGEYVHACATTHTHTHTRARNEMFLSDFERGAPLTCCSPASSARLAAHRRRPPRGPAAVPTCGSLRATAINIVHGHAVHRSKPRADPAGSLGAHAATAACAAKRSRARTQGPAPAAQRT